MADKLYYVSSVNVQLKHYEQLMKCIHNKLGFARALLSKAVLVITQDSMFAEVFHHAAVNNMLKKFTGYRS